jgi:2-oxoglutarate ferredoxin oxidoreductase subunit alpha
VIDALRDEGIKIGMIRPITLHPFPEEVFEKLDYNKVKTILCIEMSNHGQLIEDVKLCIARRCAVSHYGRSGGVIISPEDIYKAVKERL